MRISDWSSDVCPSDLLSIEARADPRQRFDHAVLCTRAMRSTGHLEPPQLRPFAAHGLREPARDRGRDDRVLVALRDQQRYRHERSEEHTSELQSLMRNSYAVFCLNKKKNIHQ